MTYYVRAPGTCGEFIQGAIDGQSFLVTCPINRFSYALSSVSKPFESYYCSLQPKAYKAKSLTERLLNTNSTQSIYVRSDIIQGKGMASSSADISVAAMATALSLGRPLTTKELEQICLTIEPTDAAFYPGITQFDYINGTLCKPLGMCPPLKILIFDEGGTIDTISFNQQKDLAFKINEKETIIQEALSLFIKGIECHDISLIGQAATLSAFGNQRILYKPNLYEFHDIGVRFNSVGTIIAHSGTIMGLLFPADYRGVEDCKLTIEGQLPQLTYVDTVETTNEGLTYTKR